MSQVEGRSVHLVHCIHQQAFQFRERECVRNGRDAEAQDVRRPRANRRRFLYYRWNWYLFIRPLSQTLAGGFFSPIPFCVARAIQFS